MHNRSGLLVGITSSAHGGTLPLPEAHGGNPGRALARAGALAVHLVDLLEGQTLGLVDEEVDEGDAEEAGAEPDEEHLGLQVGVVRAVVDEVGGDEGDDEVEEPL